MLLSRLNAAVAGIAVLYLNSVAAQEDGGGGGKEEVCGGPFLPGIELFLNDLEDVPNGCCNPQPSAEACCQACYENPDCEAFTWGMDRTSPNCCWLKGLVVPKPDKDNPTVSFKQVRPPPSDGDCSALKDRKKFCSEEMGDILRGKEWKDNNLLGVKIGKNNPKGSVEECCSSCIENQDCQAFSHHLDGSCFLKGYKPTQLADGNFVSKDVRIENNGGEGDPEFCSKDFVRGFFEGHDLKPGIGNIAFTAEECCQSCVDNEDCLAFSWRGNEEGFEGFCWLKGKAPAPPPGQMEDIRTGDKTLVGKEFCTTIGEARNCCMACYNAPDCQSFAWISGGDPSENCCRLRGIDGPILSTDDRKISGILHRSSCPPINIPCGSEQSVDETIKAAEDAIRKFTAEATEMYRIRRQKMKSCRPSVHACTDNKKQRELFQCIDDILGNKVACPDCEPCGRKVYLDESIVRTPPGTNVADPTAGVMESICTFQEIEISFQNEIKEKRPLSRTYIGTITGVHRMWPGIAETRCKEGDEFFPNCRAYDPRVTPWFVAASSGPKDVVLLIDVSSSMDLPLETKPGSTRWDVTREALLKMVGTFGANDFINIVTFSDKTEALVNEKSKEGDGDLLVRGTEENLEILRAAVKDIFPAGGTDFRLGFSAAFDVLIASEKERTRVDVPPTSECEKIIIFLTDGNDCTLTGQICAFDGEMPNQDNVNDGVTFVLDVIGNKQKELTEAGVPGKPARIFTFSMTTDADDRLPKMIACRNEGSWSHVSETDDPLTKMNSYLRFISWNRRDVELIWTGIYEDEDGSGRKATVAAPIYSPKIPSPDGAEDIPGQLVAVVALDIGVGELGENADITVQQRTSNNGATVCKPVELTDCQSQILRTEEGECPQMFKRETCHFLQASGHFYMASSALLPFDEAKEACSKMGWQLARVDTPDEQALLAGLSPPQGSWIGMQKFSDVWKWTTFTNGGEDGDQVVADEHRPRSMDERKLEERCATIDSRGPRHNIDSAPCDKAAHYICEFQPENAGDPAGCEDKVVVNTDFPYDVRPIQKCKDLEKAIDLETKVVEEAKALTGENVFAPTDGEPLTNDDVNCCCKTDFEIHSKSCSTVFGSEMRR